MKRRPPKVALVTGASRGLGLATARALAERGWALVIDARGREALTEAEAEIAEKGVVTAIAGDVADSSHREALIAAANELGRLDLLINNASILGPSPQPSLSEYPLEMLRQVFEVNVFAPLALIQLALPLLRETQGVVINVTSDAAVESYPGWGGYGSAKAALDQLSNVLASEEPSIAVYWFDPGDMNTDMHQQAFPGEDISDRPDPENAVPWILTIIERRHDSGHYRAAQFEGAT